MILSITVSVGALCAVGRTKDASAFAVKGAWEFLEAEEDDKENGTSEYDRNGGNWTGVYKP